MNSEFKIVGFNNLPIPTQFELVRSHKSSSELPSQIQFPVKNDQDVLDFFLLARKGWNETFDPEYCLNGLSQISVSGLGSIDANFLSSLKRMRRFGNTYKQAQNIFIEEHVCDPKFSRLISNIGKFCDLCKYKPHSKKIPPKANYLQMDIMNILSQEEFIPFLATPSSVSSYLNYSLYEMNNHLINQTIGEKEYHDLRKENIRPFVALYQLASMRDQNNLYLDIFAYLNRIHSFLGDEHDELVKAEMKGDLSANIQVNIDDDMLKQMISFYQKIKPVLNLNQ